MKFNFISQRFKVIDVDKETTTLSEEDVKNKILEHKECKHYHEHDGYVMTCLDVLMVEFGFEKIDIKCECGNSIPYDQAAAGWKQCTLCEAKLPASNSTQTSVHEQ